MYLPRPLLLGLGLGLAACGAEDGLAISGDLAFTVGAETITPTVGAVIADSDPDKVLVVIGTRDISCSTKLESPLRKGTYVAMVIDPMILGPQAEALVTVIRVESSATLFDSATSEVTIDAVQDRLTGSVNFMIQDETEEVITATGSFDVANCLF
jgi:hypothetical protein